MYDLVRRKEDVARFKSFVKKKKLVARLKAELDYEVRQLQELESGLRRRYPHGAAVAEGRSNATIVQFGEYSREITDLDAVRRKLKILPVKEIVVHTSRVFPGTQV